MKRVNILENGKCDIQLVFCFYIEYELTYMYSNWKALLSSQARKNEILRSTF